MPTSATGPSSSRTRRAPAATHTSGFTLLEVLVVIVIIGIITSMAMVSVHVLGGDHEMDQEAKRLVALLTQAREDATLQGRDLGLRMDTRGYDFLDYDARTERWNLVTDDPMLRERSFPDGLEAALWLESRPVKLPARAEPTERTPPAPQIVVMASGDVVPFEIRLSRAGTEQVRAIAGSADGTIQRHDPDDHERR